MPSKPSQPLSAHEKETLKGNIIYRVRQFCMTIDMDETFNF